MFWVVESFRSFGPAAIVGWAVGLTAGSVVLTYLYRGSGNSILLVAAWHTAFNLTSATKATSGLVAAISSTAVMIAAIVIAVIWLTSDRRRPRTDRLNRRPQRSAHPSEAPTFS